MHGAGTIAAQGLSKRYRISGRRDGFRTLRDAVAESMTRTARRRRRDERSWELWALSDVSFEIDTGEIVGVIGSNGAGKSTLLKILSRITEPTRGLAEIRGRVGSLLEVGTGFHPELTGRENVFLNGAVLGMRRAEIVRRFDEIVAFAEVEDFLDTPVKRYSSGMSVRLAFSVAAHLDLEILLVDEVLAVGDAAFQRKCLGKMGDVASEGRTVLFVSHNMAVVQAFCRRGIVIEHGRVAVDDDIDVAVRSYLSGLERAGQDRLVERTDRRGWREVLVEAIAVTGDPGLPEGTVLTGGSAQFTFQLSHAIRNMGLTFTILNVLGQPVARLSSERPSSRDRTTRDRAAFTCDMPVVPLVPGRYRIDLALNGGGHLQDAVEAAAFFNVEEGVFDGRGLAAADIAGNVLIAHSWTSPAEPVG